MKTVICSHGFGVDATDRGLFTDIAGAFPDLQFVMFDYNKIDDQGNMTVRPLDGQVQILNKKLAQQSGEVIVLAHSLGCVVASMAKLEKVNRLILLTPPDSLSIEWYLRIFGRREGAVVNPESVSSFPRRDGTTTYVDKAFLDSIATVDARSVIGQAAETHSITILRATDDEIVGKTDFSTTHADILTVKGSHDFSGPARTTLIETLRGLIHTP